MKFISLTSPSPLEFPISSQMMSAEDGQMSTPRVLSIAVDVNIDDGEACCCALLMESAKLAAKEVKHTSASISKLTMSVVSPSVLHNSSTVDDSVTSMIP